MHTAPMRLLLASFVVALAACSSVPSPPLVAPEFEPQSTEAGPQEQQQLPQGPVDTGGFLVFTIPTDGGSPKCVGAYWVSTPQDDQGITRSQTVYRWTVKSLQGLDRKKAAEFKATTPLLSEAGGPYTVKRIAGAKSTLDVRNGLREACGRAPEGDKEDANYTFWRFDARPRV